MRKTVKRKLDMELRPCGTAIIKPYQVRIVCKRRCHHAEWIAGLKHPLLVEPWKEFICRPLPQDLGVLQLFQVLLVSSFILDCGAGAMGRVQQKWKSSREKPAIVTCCCYRCCYCCLTLTLEKKKSRVRGQSRVPEPYEEHPKKPNGVKICPGNIALSRLKRT